MSNIRRPRGFIGNVLTLMTGTTIAQSLGIVTAPILSRLYNPEDYGVFAIYISMMTILGVIVCWRYETGIVLPEKDEDGVSLLILSLFFCLSMSGLVLILMVWLGDSIANVLGTPQLKPWLLLMPISLVLWGLYQSFNYWSTRRKYFSSLAITNISQSVTTQSYQIIMGNFLTSGLKGLLGGYILGQFLASTLLMLQILKKDLKYILNYLNFRRIISIGYKYRALPQYMLQTSLLNSISSNALPFLLSYFSSPFWAGMVMFAQKIIQTPVNFIVNSLWQVTHARLGTINPEDKKAFFAKIHRFVAYFYAFPLVSCAFFSNLSVNIFGNNWENLAQILPSICVMIYINAVSNSTSYFAAFGYYQAEAYANIALVITRVTAIIIGSMYFDAYEVVNIYAYCSALVYLSINLFWAIKLEKIAEFFLGNLLSSIAISIILNLLAKLIMLNLGLIPGIIMVLLLGLLYYFFAWKKMSSILIG